MSMTLEQAKEKLAKYGQEHVLKYYGGAQRGREAGDSGSDRNYGYEHSGSLQA